MSAHAANSRLANSFSVLTHTTSRSPPIETGTVADVSGYSGKRDVNGISCRDPTSPAAPCSGVRPSAAPCSASPSTSAKSVSGVSASEYTVSKNGHANGSSTHHNSALGDGLRGREGEGVSGAGRGHGLGTSPATTRRGEGGRQSRMDATNFRLRLRKGGGEGVTKKGPMVGHVP